MDAMTISKFMQKRIGTSSIDKMITNKEERLHVFTQNSFG